MIWWFLILGVSTLVVVCVAIALYVRLRRHLQKAHASHDAPLSEVERPRQTEQHRTLKLVRFGGSVMAKSAIQILSTPQERALEASRQVALVVGASLVVALCARITIPLMPLTPVPLTVQNMGVLLVGLMLGSRRGFAALALYLAEGVVGLPVFNPTGPGGIAQLLGPTGGFLMVYPFVAFLAGYIFERGTKSFLRAAICRIPG